MIQLLATPIGRKTLLYTGFALCFIGTHVLAYYEGWEAKGDAVKVENAKLAAKAAEEYKVRVEQGNQKAAEVQEQKQAAVVTLTEVLVHVPKVTTNRTCLSHDAVRLLNKPTTFGLSASAPRPATEDAGGTATDTDVVEWIAKAKEQYARCAANNNGIVDILTTEDQK